MKKNPAFTLAETLTTLSVIGVVAAFTVPVMSYNINKLKTINTFKSLYSSFSVNLQTVVSEANCSSISCLRKYGNSDETLHNGIFANPVYFNIKANCPGCIEDKSVMPSPMIAAHEEDETEEILNTEATIIKDDKETTADEEENGTTDENEPAEKEPVVPKKRINANFSTYLLNNGTVMSLYDFNGNCTESGKVFYDGKSADVCGIVVFDINSKQGPNAPGYDRFAYYIVDEPIENSFLVPIGYTNKDNNNDSQYNKDGLIQSNINNGTCSPETIDKEDGYNCTAKIMTSNWKRNY